MGDIIFFRYNLINRALHDIDSLIFSIWADPDIGEYDDDLLGSNIVEQIAYVYNAGTDAVYGNNPPAFGIKLLQGPVVAAEGEVAFRYQGDYFATDTIKDARNLAMSGGNYSFCEWDPIPFPFIAQTARYKQLGCFHESGQVIHPSQWGVGGNQSIDCRFFYNGDPVAGTGWRDNDDYDKKMYINCGFFDLAAGDTQTVILAYLLGQGSSALNSITEMIQRGQLAESIIGFSNFPVGIAGPPAEPQLNAFILAQNYPNPFNPSTTFRYTLPRMSHVLLSVYNMLGQEVYTLVNEQQTAGPQEVSWDGHDHLGRRVSSGIYIFRIQAGEYMQSRKMLLLR